MALQHLDGSARRVVLPEALARFSHDVAATQRSPLRAMTYVALGIDTLMILASMMVGFLVRSTGQYPLAAATAILVVWLGMLAVRRSYDSERIGVGSEEFKNVITATIGSFALFASIGFVLEITDGRRFLIGTFAAGIILLPLGRRLMRVWVFDRRRDGHLMRRTLLIGEGRSLKELKVRLSFDPRTGFEVVESMPGPSAGPRGIDGWLDQVEQAIVDQDVDAVAISQTSSISSEVIRRLSWRLEGPNVALLVAPALGDATGPRLNIRPAAGLPLLHLDEPRLTGPQALLKRATDIFVSGLGLLLISPLLLLIALAIRITSPGHALFIQDRVGQAGEVYRLVKFRSMYDGSEEIRTDTLGSLAGDPESYRTDPGHPVGTFPAPLVSGRTPPAVERTDG